ncbi:hypothetical protein ABTX81_37695 [Kitasatospora sp. NPDC097605]|uniref:DUF3040 domain-containing protein n=1 Tax=Kitasatospora sp. NPDC097605 TaxID=3157226 RepID=UPI00333089AC
MDGPALSGRERRLLAEIEGELRRDTRLDQRLSTMGAKRPNRLARVLCGLGRLVPGGVLMTALVMSAICLSVAVRKPTVTMAIATAVVWVGSIALAAGVSAVLRRRRRGRVETADDLLDGGYREPRTRGWPGEPTDGGGPGEERRDRQDRRERRPWDHPEM